MDGSNREGLASLEKHQEEIDAEIEQLDTKLSEVLRRQEYEYLQAYNIYVKKKEKELRMLITTLQDKNEDKNFKERRIADLELTIDKLRQDSIDNEKKLLKLQKDVKLWKDKHKTEVEEKEFFHKQALEAKRKNKLLKVAIVRIQTEGAEPVEQPPMMIESHYPQKDENVKDNTFLTGANIEEKLERLEEDIIDNPENSQAIVEQNLLNNPTMQKRRGQS